MLNRGFKETASSSSSSSSQNIAFVSSHSNTNEVNTVYGVSTANTQVSPASTQVSTASTQVSTANLSDATVYVFLANQPNGSQFVYEDLEQIHKYDLEEMDLKWQLALLSMRTRSFETHKTQLDDLRIEFNKSEFNLATYKRGLASAEERLPEFEGYGPRTSKSVSEDISNEVMESPDAPLVEELVSDDNFDHVQADCNYHQRERVVSQNNYTKGHPQKEDQGYVNRTKGGKITGKGTLKIGKLDFEDVYFVNELQFNLFSVSQMYDKKNNVLFTNTRCFVLSPDFKLADKSQVLLKVPRKNNMYSVVEIFRRQDLARLHFDAHYGKIGFTIDSSLKNAKRPENSTRGVNTAGPSINIEPDMFSLGDNATLEATHADFFGDEQRVKTSPSYLLWIERYGPSDGLKSANMDVKSAFLYGKIEEKVYVCQPLGFEDPEFLDRVYKVEKALYGLHQTPRASYETLSTYLFENGFQRGTIDKTLFIKKVKGLHVMQKEDGVFISQDKYVDEILKKFSFSTVRIASTPIEISKPLLKDTKAEDVDVHLYRSMIGTLMYLTSSRPDIMFVVCACARFQLIPKVSHLHVVKRIFRHLKGQPKLGLWYPKNSPFNLEAYSDSDYAGASLDRKSTT
ncbi:putative ribonuclease H-like domain-containing protein [Tanacetum coccineum]